MDVYHVNLFFLEERRSVSIFSFRRGVKNALVAGVISLVSVDQINRGSEKCAILFVCLPDSIQRRY